MSGAVWYFVLMRLHPPYALALLAGILTVGAWTTWLNPDDLDSGLGMLLFVQMFLASTGFAVRARQGHFDPILTRGAARSQVVIAHCVASIAPGLVGWLLLVALGSALGSVEARSALAGERMAALAIVSLGAWCAGFLLPRGAAGVVWIAVLLALMVTRTDPMASWPGASIPILGVVIHGVVMTICPFLLIGVHPALAPGAVPVALGVVAAIWLLAVHQAGWLDVYLVDRA